MVKASSRPGPLTSAIVSAHRETLHTIHIIGFVEWVRETGPGTCYFFHAELRRTKVLFVLKAGFGRRDIVARQRIRRIG